MKTGSDAVAPEYISVPGLLAAFRVAQICVLAAVSRRSGEIYGKLASVNNLVIQTDIAGCIYNGRKCLWEYFLNGNIFTILAGTHPHVEHIFFRLI